MALLRSSNIICNNPRKTCSYSNLRHYCQNPHNIYDASTPHSVAIRNRVMLTATQTYVAWSLLGFRESLFVTTRQKQRTNRGCRLTDSRSLSTANKAKATPTDGHAWPKPPTHAPFPEPPLPETWNNQK